MSRIALSATLFSSVPINVLSVDAASSVVHNAQVERSSQVKTKVIPLSYFTQKTATSIKVGKKIFHLSKEQAALFQKNKSVLKNSRLSFSYDVNGKINSLVLLELNTSGKKSKSALKHEKNMIFDGESGSLVKRIRVNADYITIRDFKSDDLTISSRAKTLVHLSNVQIKEKIRYESTSTKASAFAAIPKPVLIMEKTAAPMLQLKQTGVIATFAAKTNIKSVDLSANASLKIDRGIKLSRVVIENGTNQVDVNGTVDTLISQSKDLNISGKATVNQLSTSTTNANLRVDVAGHVNRVTVTGNNTNLTFGKGTDTNHVQLSKSAHVVSINPIDVLDISGGMIQLDASVLKLMTTGQTSVQLGKTAVINELMALASLQIGGGNLIKNLVLSGNAKEIILNTPTTALMIQTGGADVTVKGTAEVEHVMLDSSSDIKIDLGHITKIEETTNNTGKIDMGATAVDEIKVDESKIISPAKPPVDPPVTPPVTPPSEGGGGTVEQSFGQRLDAYLADESNREFKITQDATIDGKNLQSGKSFRVDKGVKLTLAGTVRSENQALHITGDGIIDTKDVTWKISEREVGLIFSKTLTWAHELDVARHTIHKLDEDMMGLYHADRVIGSDTELAQAIETQKSSTEKSGQALDDELWLIQSGHYGLRPNTTISYGGQTGYYLPIIQSGLRIIGEEGTTFYGDTYSKNGNWSTQNLITVMADDVTLDGLTLMPKVDVNKIIEVIGGGFTLKNATITPNTKVGDMDAFNAAFAGSVYFNTGEKKTTAIIENTKINKGRITTGGASSNLNLHLTNIELNYAGSSTEQERDYYPIKNMSGANIEAQNVNVLLSSASAKELTPILAHLPSGTHLNLEDGVYALNEQLTITKGITIDGSGAVITPSEKFVKTGNRPTDNLVSINDVKEPVKLNGITVQHSHATGIQAYRSTDVILKDIKSFHNAAAGLIVNGSTVSAKGLHTSNNVWYGVNVDSGKNITEPSRFTLLSGTLEEEYEVVSDVANSSVHVTLPSYYKEHVIEKTTKKYWTTHNERLGGVYVIGEGGAKQYETPQAAVAAAKENDTLLINGIIALKEQLIIDHPLRIKGERNGKFVPAENFKVTKDGNGKDYNPSKNLVSIENVDGMVDIEDLEISKALRSGLQVYRSSKVSLKDVTLKDNTAAGLIVNGSTVMANRLYTSGNGWYGVNVDQGTGVTTLAKFVLQDGSLREEYAIHSDGGLRAGQVEIEFDPETHRFRQVHDGTKFSYINLLKDGVYLQKNGTDPEMLERFSTINAAVEATDSGDTIWIAGKQEATEQIVISHGLVLKAAAGRASIVPGRNFKQGDDKNGQNLITIDAKDEKVILQSLDISHSMRNGLNVYRSSNVSLKDVTSRDNVGAGLIVNGSTVRGDGFDTSGNGWYGVGVAPGSGVKELSRFELLKGNLEEAYAIFASPKDVAAVEVTDKTTQYIENRIATTDIIYWTKITASRLPGTYVEHKTGIVRYPSLQQAIDAAAADEVVLVNGEQILTKQILIKKGIELKGENDARLLPAKNFSDTQGVAKHLLTIEQVEGLVTLHDLTVENSYGSGINIYRSGNVVLKNVTSRNNLEAGIIVNRSTVQADEVNTSGNKWYGINVALGSGSDSDDPAHLTFRSGELKEEGQIVSEDFAETNENVVVIADGFKYGQIVNGDKPFSYWTNRLE